MRTAAIATALLGLGTSVYAQSVSTTQGGITYAFSVPETSASSDSGDIYISISAPTSYSWVGLGSGSSMSGAKMFIVYQNAAGTNVTLSPRSSSGEVQPKYDSSANATLAAGSGVSNGVMTAVILCGDCASKFSITSDSADIIYAAKTGSAIKSDSQSYSISQHDSNAYGSTSIDMTKAQNSANSNPFAASSSSSNSTSTASSSSGSSTVSCVPASSTSASSAAQTSGYYYSPFGAGESGRPSYPSGSGYPFVRRADTAANACPSGYVPASDSSGSTFSQNGSSNSQRTSMLMAHGIMAGLAFAVLFPFGAISIRLLNFPGLVAFHAVFQICAYLFYIIAFGLGVNLARQMGMLNATHPIIGILLFVLLLFMPILGFVHHRNFKKFQRRTVPSHMHLWLGRAIIPLGIINGGLGFALADNTKKGPIIYGIVAIIFFLAYIAAIVIGEQRKKKQGRNQPPKYEDVLLQDHRSIRSQGGSPPRHQEYYGGRRK